MKSILIKGSKRESVGKKDSKALRNAEKVPCVLYGGNEVLHFSVDEMLLKPLVYTPDVYTANIDFGGNEMYDAVMHDIQFHPVTDKILHIDFYQLHEDKPITLSIPVKFQGSPLGVRAGGSLKITNNRLSVSAIPKNLPDVINIDIEKLKIGDKITVGNIRNEDYKLNHPDNIVICQVRMARGAAVGAVTEETDEDDE